MSIWSRKRITLGATNIVGVGDDDFGSGLDKLGMDLIVDLPALVIEETVGTPHGTANIYALIRNGRAPYRRPLLRLVLLTRRVGVGRWFRPFGVLLLC